MKDFLKENLVLVSGIALPLVLALVFFASTQIGKITEDPPQYSVIFADNYYNYNSYNNSSPYLFKVVEDKGLEFHYTPPKPNDNGYTPTWNEPKLYVYNPKTDKVSQITLPYYDKDTKQTIAIPDFNNKKLSRRHESPDGYEFKYGYASGGSNLMTEVFGGGSRYRYRNALVKGDYRHYINTNERYLNGNFIAWIIE